VVVEKGEGEKRRERGHNLSRRLAFSETRRGERNAVGSISQFPWKNQGCGGIRRRGMVEEMGSAERRNGDNRSYITAFELVGGGPGESDSNFKKGYSDHRGESESFFFAK